MTANISPPPQSHTGNCDDGLSAFLSIRPRLFGIAYHMLGSAAEAEDVVQDAWLRWQTTDRRLVRDAAAFLATTATRLAINVMHSARARRETSIGPGHPEPVDASSDPYVSAERDQALACSVRMLLQRLTPTERAAYILREAFDYAYRDIAIVLRLAEANARQVVTRARQHITTDRTRVTSSTEQKRLLGALITAVHDGDVASLEHFFASGFVSSRTTSRAVPDRDSTARRPSRSARGGRWHDWAAPCGPSNPTTPSSLTTSCEPSSIRFRRSSGWRTPRVGPSISTGGGWSTPG